MKIFKKSISITLDEDILDKTKELADSESSSVSYIINRLLKSYFKNLRTKSDKE